MSEARTLANLDHPGIVLIYDLGRTDDGRCYLVFKYIEGRSLEDRLNEGTVSCGAAADLVRTMAEALHAAHARGVVHRDVKPGTSCWMPAVGRSWPTSGWRLRETDFGTGPRLVGTIVFMSPEQARGRGTASMAARTSIAWA